MPSVETDCPVCGTEMNVAFEEEDSEETDTIMALAECPDCKKRLVLEIKIKEGR